MTFAPPPTAASLAAKGKAKSSRSAKKLKPTSPRAAKRFRFGLFGRRCERERGPDADGDRDIELGVLASAQSLHHHDVAHDTALSHTTITAFHPAFDPNDTRFAKPTRAALKMLYASFGGLVWVLGLLVNVLAAGVVGVGAVARRL